MEGDLAQPLILYSAVTKLAYFLAETYYDRKHFVWCAPARVRDKFIPGNPPSADPIVIYRSLANDVRLIDGHSAKIADNRKGLIRGAYAKERDGAIDAPTREHIEAMITIATVADFRPLLLVMPYERVKGLLKYPVAASVASAMSREYVIEALPHDCFDVLELED